jgi:hypothetical protein
MLIYLFNPAGELNNFKRVWNSLKNMNMWYLSLSLVITLISLYLSAYRRQLLAVGVDKKLKLGPAMTVVLGYEFLSAITPFGGGGQPLEVWILKKNGFSWGKGIVITYMNTASMIIILFIFGPLALFFYPGLVQGHTILMFMIYGMIFLFYFVLLTILSIFRPRFAKKVTNSILKIARKIRLIKDHKFYATLKHALKEIKTFNIHIREYFSGRILLFLYILFVTFVTYAIKWLAAFTICLALGVYVDPIKLVLAQMFILFANYSIPTPGASGTSEILALSIFAILTPNMEVVTMTLWRFFTFHLIFLISMIPSIRVIQMKEKEKHLHAEDIIRPDNNLLKDKKA